MTKSEYETLAKSLIGEVIEKIEYFEVKYDGYETDFEDDGCFDSLDYGSNLFMESGEVFGFIWGDEFFQYGFLANACREKMLRRICRTIGEADAEREGQTDPVSKAEDSGQTEVVVFAPSAEWVCFGWLLLCCQNGAFCINVWDDKAQRLAIPQATINARAGQERVVPRYAQSLKTRLY